MFLNIFIKKFIVIILLCTMPILCRSFPISFSTAAICVTCPAIPLAYGAYKCAGLTAGFPCATAPWIKWITNKNLQDTKTFSDEEEGYEGPVVVHFTGCADHYQSHEKILEAINSETKQPVIAVNYSKIQTSFKGLTEQATHDLIEELNRQKITPTEITFLGHSTGAAVSDKVAKTVEKKLSLKKRDISIISFCSFDKLNKIIKFPEWAFSLIGWNFNPAGQYKTHVIRDKDDTFMEDSHRSPVNGGELFKVESASNHHLNWEAVSINEIDGKKKNVKELIIKIINGGRPDTVDDGSNEVNNASEAPQAENTATGYLETNASSNDDKKNN